MRHEKEYPRRKVMVCERCGSTGQLTRGLHKINEVGEPDRYACNDSARCRKYSKVMVSLGSRVNTFILSSKGGITVSTMRLDRPPEVVA